jgi:CubicO group peptidase (beta-lactamase class C family)
MFKIYFNNIIAFLAMLLWFCACSSNETNKLPNTVIIEEPKILYNINAPSPIDKIERDRIFYACKQYYDTSLLPSGFNGGIIVAKGGNIIFEKYRGFENIDSIKPVTASTPLHIASVSKTFTAMAILKLQELGKLNVNDSLTKYFPNFNYPGVTIKTLLNHRSGLPNYLHFLKEVKWPDSVNMRNDDVLNLLITKKNVLTAIVPADTKFAYNNTNYALLALVIEKVSGMKYPDFMRKNIFEPIGMKNTFVRYNMDSTKVTKSFDWKGRLMGNTNLDEVYGDKNIYSTVGDLLKWDRVLADSIFLSNASLQMAYTPYSNEKPGIKNYGFGWRMNIYEDGKKILFHNGWWRGNNAVFIRLIKEDVTIIAMSNRFARPVYGAKILVNIFGNYFTEKTEEEDSIIPANIPEVFPAETKKGKKKKVVDHDFRDMNQPEEPKSE